MRNLFNQNSDFVRLYEKFGAFDCRAAKAGENVLTIINDQIETTNVARDGDVVVRGPKGEEYIISLKKFVDRYRVDKALTDDYQKFETKGRVLAYMHIGPSFKFVASWGEEMIVDDGDYLATPCNLIPLGFDDEVYRIERTVFNETYRLVNEK